MMTQTSAAVRRRPDGRLAIEPAGLDDLAHSMSYRLLVPPIPVHNHVATLRLARITEPDHAFVDWLARYDGAPGDEAALRDAIDGVLGSGLESLNRARG